MLAEPVLTVLLEYGMFTRSDTLAAVPIVRAYVLGVLPVSLVKIYAPSFYSLGHPRLPMLASIAAVAVNLCWNAFTHRRLGVAGLALGTTLAAAVNYAIVRFGFQRLMADTGGADPDRRRHLMALVVSNAVMGGVAWAFWRAGVWLLGGPDHRLRGLLAMPWLAATIVLGFLCYALLLRAWRYPGAEELLAIPRRGLERLRRITG